MRKKYSFLLAFIFITSIIILFSFSPVSLSAYPKLISTLIDGFETIKAWIIRIATPAAAVAVRNRNFYEKI